MDEKQQTFLEMNLSEFEMNLIDLPELSIIIHYRRDCEDREFNLKTLLKFIDDHFTVNDIVLVNDDKEFEKSLKLIIPEVINNVKLMFVENDDEFMKSYSFNRGAEHATGSVFAFWDVDVLIDPKYIEKSYNIIVDGLYDHVYPFNGYFVAVEKLTFPKFLPKYDFEFLLGELQDRTLGYHNEYVAIGSNISPGGCNLISRSAFNKIGGYDERFIGWGFEDTDFIQRSRKVNKVIHLDDFDAICWHLHHDNSKRLENPHYQNNIQIYNENNLK